MQYQMIQYYFWKKGHDLTILKLKLDHVGYRVKKRKKIGQKNELDRKF